MDSVTRFTTLFFDKATLPGLHMNRQNGFAVFELLSKNIEVENLVILSLLTGSLPVNTNVH